LIIVPSRRWIILVDRIIGVEIVIRAREIRR
jgi:hypothetical protein